MLVSQLKKLTFDELFPVLIHSVNLSEITGNLVFANVHGAIQYPLSVLDRQHKIQVAGVENSLQPEQVCNLT
jgi:hypothetical protein